MTEEWKPVVGFEGLYEASSHGRVKSLPRATTRGGILAKNKNKGTGYEVVTLSKNGARTSFLVHRLIAKSFCKGYAPEMDVNHKDGDKTNNNAENLEWVTRQVNIQHSHDSGLQVNAKGEQDSQSKTYIITKPNGDVVVVTGLAEFCRKEGLNRRGLYHVLSGNQQEYRGYKCENFG